jgi:hypothetical protein
LGVPVPDFRQQPADAADHAPRITRMTRMRALLSVRVFRDFDGLRS